MENTSEAVREQETPMRRVAAVSLVGTMIEWYDYFIYGTAAALVFGPVFFPALSGTLANLAAFATFAISFIVRPIGAVIFGHFGDKLGRKSMLIVSLLIMGGGTLVIGLLPTPASIGVWAPILLVLARIFQGIGVSGEWGGATLNAVEHSPDTRRGFYGVFPQIGNVIGLVLATGTFALLTTTLSHEQFLSWGWRIPFLLSLVLVAVALYIRLRVMETPAFRALKESGEQARVPILEVLRYHPKKILLALCFRISGDVQGYTVFTWSVAFIAGLGMGEEVGTAAVAIAAFVAIFTYPLLAVLSDRIGRRPIIASGAILSVLFAFPFFWLLNTGSVFLIFVAFIVMFSMSNVAHNASQGALLSEMFPTRVRYSGVSFAYHTTGIVGGGIAPFIAASLTAWSGGAPWPVALYLVGVAFITLVGVYFTRETFQEPSQETRSKQEEQDDPDQAREYGQAVSKK